VGQGGELCIPSSVHACMTTHMLHAVMHRSGCRPLSPCMCMHPCRVLAEPRLRSYCLDVAHSLKDVIWHDVHDLGQTGSQYVRRASSCSECVHACAGRRHMSWCTCARFEDAHREPPTPLRGCDECTGAHVHTWQCVPWCYESVTLLFSMTSGLTTEECVA
jgi:hypothetical protein